MQSETEENGEKKEPRKRNWLRSVLFLLRDLGIAALIVGIILLSLFIYTANWPPMVVVESMSMQHSDTESFIGTIDTGDLVLVQKTPSNADIITYVEGRARGHSTYGGYGDVIIYKEGGDFDTKSIIHRAFVRLYWNESSQSVDIPDLDNPRWELGIDWSGQNRDGSQVTSPYGLNHTVIIYGVDLAAEDVVIPIHDYIDRFQGSGNVDIAYVAKGDHNRDPDRALICLEWIVGKARGEIPWFGLLKLTLFRDPGAPCCGGWGDQYAAKNSWDALLISIVLIVAVPIVTDFGISYLLEVRRKRKEAEGVEVEPSEDIQSLEEEAPPQIQTGEAEEAIEAEEPASDDASNEGGLKL